MSKVHFKLDSYCVFSLVTVDLKHVWQVMQRDSDY